MTQTEAVSESNRDIAPYGEYKDSGVPWLGEIPMHWKVSRGKTSFRRLERPIPDNAGVVTCFRDGIVTLRSNRRITGFTEAIQEHGYQGVLAGDLVIHAMDAFAGAVGVSDSDGKCTPMYAVCEPITMASNRYFAHVVREMARRQWILALARGIRERSTDFRFDAFASQKLPLPPLDEQAAIVKYLAHVDRKIDRFVRAKRRLIALLEEQKQALIHQAVTKGLDPDVPMKDSGVEWLGEIPAHWEVLSIKRIAALRSGEAITALDFDDSGEFLVYGGNGVRGRTNRYTHDGDYVLVGRQGALCGNVNYASGRFWASEHAVVADPRRSLALRWFGELLRMMNLNQYSISAAQPGLSVERISGLQVPVPPLAEQNLIEARITELSPESDRLLNRFKREIDLIREYRTRLVSDVVTGKLDVREAAAALPEIEDELDELDVLNADVDEGDEGDLLDSDDIVEED